VGLDTHKYLDHSLGALCGRDSAGAAGTTDRSQLHGLRTVPAGTQSGRRCGETVDGCGGDQPHQCWRRIVFRNDGRADPDIRTVRSKSPAIFSRGYPGKVSLGLFFAAAVYALIVSVALTDQDQARGTVVLALGLAILAIIEFIGYIHRTASSLQADQLIQRLGQQLRQDMARLRKLGDSETLITDTEGWRRASRGLQRINLYAEREGYVQTADYHRLAACLRQSRSLGMLRVRPGDFVIPGAVLITLWQPESKEPKESRGEEELRAVLDDALVLGPVRTPIQDPQFPITQLQQIAARALSSGINDPGTAVTCIDWLTLSLAEVVDENLPGCVLIDSQGDPRLIVRNPGFAELLDHIFTPLRQFTSDDLQVAHSLLDSLISLARITKRDDHLQLLLTHGQRICDQVERESHPDYDYQHVARRLARLSRSTIGR
jgi:uncharacterized membrane protein